MVKSIVFAVALCVVCGLLLTAAATGLQDIQERNIENDRRKNVLMTVGLISPEKQYRPEQIERIYKDNIVQYGVTESGVIVDPAVVGKERVLPIYLYEKNGKIRDYILPIESQGLWGKIYGYMALKDDGETVAGFTVYSHSETPGLGGEIEKRWFRKNFEGKKIIDRNGHMVSIKIAKGDAEKLPEAKQSHYVDGISGATLTGQYLTQGLKKTLSEYEPVSIAFRKNRLRCRIHTEQPWCEKNAADPN